MTYTPGVADGATHDERRTAAAVAVLFVVWGLAAVPLGARAVPPVGGLVPALGSASVTAMLVCATILQNRYRATRFVPLACLATAYAATAGLLVPWIAFAGAGSGTAGWLWVAGHAAFALLAGGYAWSERTWLRGGFPQRGTSRIVRRYVAGASAAAVTGALALVGAKDVLPSLTLPDGRFSPAFHLAVEPFVLGAFVAVAAALVANTGLATRTQLWVAVVLAGALVETYVGGEVVRAPYTVAWTLDLALALGWQTLFVVVQLRHANDQLAAFVADNRQLVEETLRDPLTGLFNRRGFDARFEAAVRDARRGQEPLALLVLDLDHFKAYNDAFGHAAGDAALRAVGAALQNAVSRPGDACCRIGGEEFAMVLAGTDASGAATVAERARIAVARLALVHAPEGPPGALTLSVGAAALVPDEGASPEALFERADRALYRAKRLGRDRVAVEPGERPAAERGIAVGLAPAPE